MTSIRNIPNVLSGRRANTLEQEREQFEKGQESSYRKAVNEDEVPVKMKHVRNLIIGTYTDKNGHLYWQNVANAPPINTDVMAWKFCHCLHITLRDGHPNVIRDSQSKTAKLTEIGDHFAAKPVWTSMSSSVMMHKKHLKHGYGKLIQRYCELLVCKLKFHQRYPRFPGNMSVSPEELENLAENDANNYFELAVEFLEYIECILNLYEAVFQSMDPSRANSMTRSGQCRLAPLIPCIQDSSCLYDSTVRILFQLHKALPTDMLGGHRTRFYKQFKMLQKFYDSTRNLQYFKGLISVPSLPNELPNFTIEAELRSHVAPVVVVEEQPDIQDNSDSMLIDTSEPEPPPIPPHPDLIDSHNGSLAEVLAERESLIDALHGELEALRAELQRFRSQSSHNEEQLRLRINDLESTIGELDSELFAERQSKESILAQVEAAAASAEAVTRVVEEEKGRRMAEEKFNKMKEVYQKLRNEHITLIRTKAEVEKQMATDKEGFNAERRVLQESQENARRLENQIAQQAEVQKSSSEANQQEQGAVREELHRIRDEYEKVTTERDTLEVTLYELRTQMSASSQKAANEMSVVMSEWESSVHGCVVSGAEATITVISQATAHFDHELHATVKCTPDYTLVYQSPIFESLTFVKDTYSQYLSDIHKAPQLLRGLSLWASQLAAFLLNAKATSHASPNIERAENLVSALEEFAKNCIDTLHGIQSKQNLESGFATIKAHFERCCELVRNCEDQSPSKEDLTEALSREMEAMNDAITQAVERFTSMLEDTRAKDSGIQLERSLKVPSMVNEGIIGTCSELMAAVRLLIIRASDLQKEIVAAGKGGANPKDFYKRNNRWTEGLLSGAKSVAIACQALMSAADQVVSGQGKFEEVIVASREIAASSMQLTMASRVKADKSSEKLSNLNNAAKTISTLTGTVVATAENCREKIAAGHTLDFSNLSLHHAKRMEMETLVKVLETEAALEKERKKLGELRKHHYQLAGEMEGWEQEDIPK